MAIKDYFKNIFGGGAPEKKEAPQVMMSVTGAYHYRRDSYENYADDGYRKNAIVYRCVNEIANGAAAIPFKVYQGDIELEQHPLYTLLTKPNPQQAGVEYFQSLYSYLLLGGNSYAVMSEVGGTPRELYLLRPDRVRIKTSKTSIPSGYEYVIGGKTVKTYSADEETGKSEVKHVKLWNPLDDYYGLSPLMAAAIDIDNHNEINKHNINLLRNGARPTGAIVFKPSDDRGLPIHLTDSQRQQLNEDLRMRFQGSDNAGRPLLLEGDFDWKEMGLSPRDMDFLQQKHTAAKDIALCFGVPSQLIGIPDSQTYANVQEARLALYEETIIPLARRVESDMNEWLAPFYEEDISIRYDFESIPAMAERRRIIYDNVINAVREGVISRNEARDRLGLEPITGGDDVFIAANLFPLGSPEVAPAEGEDSEEDGKAAYGYKLDVYPDGEEVPENLPDAYQLGNDEKNCANCQYYEEDGNCTVWDAMVRPEYVCARWEPIDEEKYHTADPEYQVNQDPRFGEGRDVFDNVGAARRRADKLGCEGTHTVRGPDGNFYMPCSSHAIYLRVTGQPKQEELGEDAKAESDIDTTPTDAMAEAAQRGLDFRKEFNRGGTAVGVARAVQLINKERLSPRTVRRMHSYFSRHEVDKRAEGFRQGEDGYPSAGKIAWLLWGGDAGQTWARRKVKQLDAERDEKAQIESIMLPCCDDCEPLSYGEEKAPVSAKIKKAIENKVKEHNEKHGDKKGKRVTQRMLEAVFRRGVGAYRTNPESVRPTVMGPDQWGLARVNAFLFAVRNNKFRSGQFDRDLLPKDHPLRSDK